MGGFYGSIQTRTENRDEVIGVVDVVARSLGIRTLVGPLINGWVGIYPENGGQDERVGSEMAKQLDCDLIHLLVHDDDIFAYWLYRNQQLVDSFWSAPGYFSEDNRLQEEAMKGEPELFRPIIQEKVSRLPALLSRDMPDFAFACERLEKFAKLLKISNAVTSYEYLKGGETDGIKGWRQFQEMPGDRVQSEAEMRRQSKEQLKSERKRLKSEGLLLFSDARTLVSPRGCATENGFVVAWTDCVTSVSFEEHRMPWRAPQPVTLLPQKHLAGIASDRTGRRIAMTAADRIKIYDKVDEAWKHVVDIPESDHAIGVLISPDGIRVSHISRYEITTTDVSNERMILRLPSHGCREIACHPKEDWLAVCGDSFGLISLENEPFWRDLHVGGKSDVFSLLGFNLPKSKIENIELEEVKAKQQKAAEKAVEQFRAILKSSNVDATEEAVEELKCNIANAYERWNARFVELKSGVKPPPITSNETVGKVGFSRDGKLFWCATNRGIRVYNWGDINRELGAEMPSPQWHFNFPEEQPPANPGQKNVTATDRVFAIAEEINEPAIVFGGMLGRLYRMDLTTGETREIMTFPGVYWILDLVFSLDGTVLGMTATISPKLADPHDRKTKKTTWDLWSFEKLVGARGNLYSE